MSENIKRVGILGCASISQVSVINPLKHIGNIQLYGIASRSFERAKDYAFKYGIPNIFKDYSELLQCKEIDFVYIPLSNESHAEWAVNSARAKKHILLEKPACLKPDDFIKVLGACSENEVKILEAIMVQHHPWQKYLADMAEARVYGRLEGIKTQVGFLPKENFKGNYRTLPECGGGAFFDLGPYWLQLLQCFGDITEAEYEGYSCFDGPNGCDWTFNANMKLKNGISAEFTGSFEQSYQASHELFFENSKVRVEDFYRANFANLKVALTIDDYRRNSKETVLFPPQNYYVNQLKFFSEVIDGVRENIDPFQTYKRILVMERIYEDAKRAFKNKKRVVNNEEI